MENHYNFFTPLIIHTFGLLLLRITTKLQECTEITTFATAPSHNPYIVRTGLRLPALYTVVAGATTSTTSRNA